VGLVLVSDNLSLLKRLKEQDNHELFVKLIYGKSYYRQARWAEENGLPVMAVNEIRFFSGEDRHVYHVLRAIDLIKPLDELPWDERVSEEAFPIHLPASPDEMRSYFSPIPSACENAAKLPERMQTGQLKSSSFIFPGFRGMEQEETCRYLRVLCEKGIRKRYGEPTLQIKKRLDYELNIIRKKNFSSYFLVVHDIVSRCPRTCGRGSSASSIVSYLLGITHVDPLKYNLFFERFLNMGRKDPPDIDVDFPWDERDEVLDYVFTSH
jgi:DNA polymerase III alpha subunit